MTKVAPTMEDCKNCNGCSCENFCLVTLKELAQRLSMSVRTISRQSELGNLPKIKKIGHSVRICINGAKAFLARLSVGVF